MKKAIVALILVCCIAAIGYAALSTNRKTNKQAIEKKEVKKEKKKECMRKCAFSA